MLLTENRYNAIKTENVETVYKNVASDFQEAQNIILPYLGQDFLTELEETENPTDEVLEIINRLCSAIYNIGIGKSLNFRQVQISDSGVQRIENNNSKTAYRYQKEEAKAYFLEKGFNAIESALAYLEENTAIFTTWAQGEGRQLYYNFIIKSAREFNQYYNIKGSRLTYISFAHLMRDVEFLLEENHIGIELVQEIKDQLEADNLSEENEKLISRYLGPYIAYKVVSKAIVDNAVEITPSGVFMNHVKGLMTSNEERLTATDAIRESKKDALNREADRYLNDMIKYLNKQASATLFASYYNSEFYTNPNPIVTQSTAKHIYGA